MTGEAFRPSSHGPRAYWPLPSPPPRSLLKAYAWAASRGSDLTQAADAGLTPAERLVPPGTEAALVPYEQGGPFPGLFVFTEPARMLRPVVQAGSGMVELVGTLEQAYLDIACPDGGHNGSPGLKFTHRCGV